MGDPTQELALTIIPTGQRGPYHIPPAASGLSQLKTRGFGTFLSANFTKFFSTCCRLMRIALSSLSRSHFAPPPSLLLAGILFMGQVALPNVLIPLLPGCRHTKLHLEAPFPQLVSYCVGQNGLYFFPLDLCAHGIYLSIGLSMFPWTCCRSVCPVVRRYLCHTHREGKGERRNAAKRLINRAGREHYLALAVFLICCLLRLGLLEPSHAEIPSDKTTDAHERHRQRVKEG